MKPVSPVAKGFEQLEVVFAKDQPEYLPLPALPIDDGNRLITRWRLTMRERLLILFHGNVYLWISTFKNPLQPVAITAEAPEFKTA